MEAATFCVSSPKQKSERIDEVVVRFCEVDILGR